GAVVWHGSCVKAITVRRMLRWWFMPARPIPSCTGCELGGFVPTARRENEHVDHHHPPDHSCAHSDRRSADLAVQFVVGLHPERHSGRIRHRDACAAVARQDLVERAQEIQLAYLDAAVATNVL